ncbi:unnamed protein product [Lepidochelys kempii]
MRLLDISPTVGLSFVLDTTGSMGEEIGAARLQARNILTRRLGGPEEPDFYLLVPFHDPGFGPVHKTSDADEFLRILNSISPLAGGDEPEMCLSALQLALLHSPPHVRDLRLHGRLGEGRPPPEQRGGPDPGAQVQGDFPDHGGPLQDAGEAGGAGH